MVVISHMKKNDVSRFLLSQQRHDELCSSARKRCLDFGDDPSHWPNASLLSMLYHSRVSVLQFQCQRIVPFSERHSVFEDCRDLVRSIKLRK